MKTLIASNKLPRLVIPTILAALMFGCAAVGTVGDNGDVPHALVKFGDLNLSSRDGATALYGRIRVAAYNVCRSRETDIRDLPELAGLNACVHNAVRTAVAEVNQPALSAIYNARHGDPLPITVVTAQNR